MSDPEDGVPPWAVVVLTGGGSRRMGQDKATLDVAGVTLLDRTLAGLPVDVDVIVAGPPVSVARSGVRFVQEDPPGGGPVAGIDAALAAVTAPVAVILATDLPLVGTLPTQLVHALLDTDDGAPAPDAVLAVDASGRAQQLCGAYRTAALRRAIDEGGPVSGAAMRSVVERLNTSTLSVIAVREARGATVEVDPTWDIDTPEDLHALNDLFGERATDH
ncbi:MAG: molybdenum cofactor guanylyltransferase [Actinomycetia bacterium]|nr:molybdenum cofactor guanylyltransferase [Actinomycetes bacterium]